MTRILLLPVLALFLVSCTERGSVPTEEEAQEMRSQNVDAATPDSDPREFSAIGQEPGWMLSLTPGERVVIEWDYATERADFAMLRDGELRVPTSLSLDNGEDTLFVSISDETCTDPMNGRQFPYTVEATINDEALAGCGEWVEA